MSEMDLFLNKVKDDEALQKKLLDVVKSTDELKIVPGFIAVAEEFGFTITEMDVFRHFQRGEAGGVRALSENMLEAVVGGGGGIKDTEDKEWWEYIVEGISAVTKGLGHCFTGDCQVSTPEGPKAIREIRTGDEVISLDADGRKRVAKVIEMIAPREMPVVEVAFDNGSRWSATKTQWFYCGGDEYACVMNNSGSRALTLDGGTAGVQSAVETGRTEPVYDIVVEGLNVMFINGIAAEGFSLS